MTPNIKWRLDSQTPESDLLMENFAKTIAVYPSVTVSLLRVEKILTLLGFSKRNGSLSFAHIQ